MTTLLGYLRSISKKTGNPYCRAYVSVPYSGWDMEKGFVGQKVQDIYIPGDQLDYLKPEHVGKELVIEAEPSGRVTHVTVK